MIKDITEFDKKWPFEKLLMNIKDLEEVNSDYKAMSIYAVDFVDLRFYDLEEFSVRSVRRMYDSKNTKIFIIERG